MSEKFTYKEIKYMFLNDDYYYCKMKFRENKINKWYSLESGLGFALEQMENCFSSPTENLMVYVIYIIARAGRNSFGHNNILKYIDKILSKYSLEELTKNLDKEEKEEFLYDLNLVLENRELENLKNSFEYKW